MLGAVFGDIVGSSYEWHNVKTKDFPLERPGTRYTDDSVMTLAVAKWLLEDPSHGESHLINPNRSLGPISLGDIKVFSCSPESKECLSLVHRSYKT